MVGLVLGGSKSWLVDGNRTCLIGVMNNGLENLQKKVWDEVKQGLTTDPFCWDVCSLSVIFRNLLVYLQIGTTNHSLTKSRSLSPLGLWYNFYPTSFLSQHMYQVPYAMRSSFYPPFFSWEWMYIFLHKLIPLPACKIFPEGFFWIPTEFYIRYFQYLPLYVTFDWAHPL